MSGNALDQIERKLHQADGLDAAERQELLTLVSNLKLEMESLGDDHAESIAGFAGAAAHEAMRSERNPDLLEHAVRGLSESVKELESEHPRTVEIVNGICTMLSNLGI